MARSCIVGMVTETGCVQRFHVTIAYTATRAAEGIAIAIGRAQAISRCGKGGNYF